MEDDMTYSGYELLWLFFVYSFLGWVLETVVAAAGRRQFVNRGLVNAPLCIIYGFSALAVTLTCGELHGIWLFAGGFILSTVIEWTAGHCIEYFYHERWWDYSGVKWNLDGYICLPASVAWGLLCVAVMEWGNPLLTDAYDMLPGLVGEILLGILTAILAVDIVATLCLLSGRSRRMEQWEDVDAWLSGISSTLGKKIYGWTDRRIRRAYPKAEHHAKVVPEEKKKVFAYGCGFYKILWLFFCRCFPGGYRGNPVLPDYGGCLDEPQQCGLGTVQSGVGNRYRGGDPSAVPVPGPVGPFPLPGRHVSGRCL